MDNQRTELSINTEVLEKMAEIAALEVEGVVSICKKAIDLKNAVKNKNAFKGVKVESVNGAIKISVYVCVKKEAKVRGLAEKIQTNVKEKVQTMTGTAVTQVNVHVSDILIEEAEQ